MRPDFRSLPVCPTTRFAPSPTGPLHIGHVANAVWVWGIAQATGGRVILRIEDHDRGRCRPEFEAGILRDLEWLGLEPEEACRQSDHDDRYREALERLAAAAPVYRCECSRKAIAARFGDAAGAGGELWYPGTCRNKGLGAGPGRGVRVVLPDQEIAWYDLLQGRIVQRPSRQCGDLLVRDSHGNWTYQFAVVVDDLEQDVDLVIRGDDLTGSTGRQILLAGLLGRQTPPAWVHHPLIRDDSGAKLSKRDGAPALATIRSAGRPPEAVLGLAAHLTGLQPAPVPVAARELGLLFR